MSPESLPKVCVVSPLYHRSLGGLGRQAMALTERLETRGLKVFVIARKMENLPECVFSAKVPVHRVWALCPTKHNLESRSILNLFISLSFCLTTAWRLIRKRKEYDVVHFHGASLPLLFNTPLLRLLRKRIVAKVAAAGLGTEAGSLGGRYLFLGAAMAGLLKKVDRFIATSREIELGLLADGYGPGKIARIPNFVDGKEFYPPTLQEREAIKARMGRGGRRIIAFSGRLVPRKGITGLLEAFARVRTSLPETVLLIMGDGPLKAKLLDESRALGLEESVVFTGSVREVRDFLAAADLFAFPSLQEGLPNAVLEAMACGLPVIATRIGGVEDVIRHEESGLLVNPGSVEELARAMTRVLSDPILAEGLAEKARARIAEKHDIDGIAKEYEKLYADVMANPLDRGGAK